MTNKENMVGEEIMAVEGAEEIGMVVEEVADGEEEAIGNLDAEGGVIIEIRKERSHLPLNRYDTNPSSRLIPKISGRNKMHLRFFYIRIRFCSWQRVCMRS